MDRGDEVREACIDNVKKKQQQQKMDQEKWMRMRKPLRVTAKFAMSMQDYTPEHSASLNLMRRCANECAYKEGRAYHCLADRCLEYTTIIKTSDGGAFLFPHVFLREADRWLDTLPGIVQFPPRRIACGGIPTKEPRDVEYLGDEGVLDLSYGMDISRKAKPWPREMKEMRDVVDKVTKRILREVLDMKEEPSDRDASLNAVLLNMYPDLASSMGRHRDLSYCLKEQPFIASLSLGAARLFRFVENPPEIEAKQRQRKCEVRRNRMARRAARDERNDEVEERKEKWLEEQQEQHLAALEEAKESGMELEGRMRLRTSLADSFLEKERQWEEEAERWKKERESEWKKANPIPPPKEKLPKSRYYYIPLGHGSLLLMIGREIQSHYEHDAPKGAVGRPEVGPRWNLNFRHHLSYEDEEAAPILQRLAAKEKRKEERKRKIEEKKRKAEEGEKETLTSSD